jgi:AbrB family looped-hinge helix DNA binding protein
MRVTTKGQVTIPLEVREEMGIYAAQTEVEFVRDENGRWYLKKLRGAKAGGSRFRTAHKAGKLRMSTEDIMKLTRGG